MVKNKGRFKGCLKIKYVQWSLIIISLYFYLNLFNNALIDDAFITLGYAKAILNNGTWGIFPGHIANTATSPLNVLLLTVMGWFIGPTIQAPICLALLSLSAIAVMLTRISLRLFNTENFGYLAFLALAFNPLLISTMGLEGLLFTAIFVISIYCYLAHKWILLAVVLGFLTITRTEGVLFFWRIFAFHTWGEIKITVNKHLLINYRTVAYFLMDLFGVIHSRYAFY